MTTANPWGLTPRQAQTLDAIIEHGSGKGAARALELSLPTVQAYATQAAERMGVPGSRAKYLIMWDRWRRGEATAVPQNVELTGVQRLGAAIERALGEAPASDVLSVLIGSFVGLTVELVRRQGHDLSLPIKVDGGPERDITIHAPKR